MGIQKVSLYFGRWLWIVTVPFLVLSCSKKSDQKEAEVRIAPVRVATIEKRSIQQVRVFSGSLEARAEFVVAPKVGGRIESLEVDVADRVSRGQIVARLDDAEYEQAIASAKADEAVANANLTEASHSLTIAQRELERVETLRERGVASESQSDSANASFLAAEAKLAVAQAQLIRSQASLETTRIRSDYTRVVAEWSDKFGDESRVVAKRFVSEGDTVGTGDPLFLVVELNPITAVFYVTERDYSKLRPGQQVEILADALPNEPFSGEVSRISPVFDTASRQARIEIDIQNTESVLKPGMFVRISIVLDKKDAALAVPNEAITSRSGRTGVFLISEDHTSVKWLEVKTGIENDEYTEITEPDISGYVVTLGQHLVDDGSLISLPEGIPGL